MIAVSGWLGGQMVHVVGVGVEGREYRTRARKHSSMEALMSARIAAANVKLKRAYEPHSKTDGTRVLIDRLWPRGVKKADAALDHWLKELAPSTRLRKWCGHDAARWEEFRRRYADEVRQHHDQLEA